MAKLKYYGAILLLAFSVACAVPKTFNEGVAAGIGTVTTARDLTLTLLNANKITADDAENVQKQADNIREALVIARALYVKDCPPRTPPVPCQSPAANAKLDATTTALTALQAYLAARQGAK